MSMNIEPLAKWPDKDTEERRNWPGKSTWANTLDLIATSIIQTPVFGESVYRTAAKLLHPDKGGSSEEFKKLESAWRLVKAVQKDAAKSAGGGE